MSTSTHVLVAGTEEQVTDRLTALASSLGNQGAVWVDVTDDPFPGSHPSFDLRDGQVEVEFFHEQDRAGAIGRLTGLLNAIDPHHTVFRAGDLHKRAWPLA